MLLFLIRLTAGRPLHLTNPITTMKRDKRSTMTANMEPLNAFVDEAERVSDIRLEFKSDIHLRITVNRKWTDFWPTTGKWFDSDTRKKGTDVQWLIELLKRRCGMHGPAPAPKPRESHQPSIRERLAIIDLQVAAIRAELFPKETSSTPEPLPAYMKDELDHPDEMISGDAFLDELVLSAEDPKIDPIPAFAATLPKAPAKDVSGSFTSVSDLLKSMNDEDKTPPW